MLLTVVHDGYRVAATEGEVTFGRAGQLQVGPEDPVVHRILGRFVHHQGHWWVENLGGRLSLWVSLAGGLALELPAVRPPASAPGAGAAADPGTSLQHRSAQPVGPDLRVEIRAGSHRYRLWASVASSPPPTAAHEPPPSLPTQPAAVLTDDEHALLQILAANVLTSGRLAPDRLPSNRSAARQLGWSISKLNRKLDYLCHRLHRLGFDGLRGGLGEEATMRRWRLVEHALTHGLVRPLPAPAAGPAPTTASRCPGVPAPGAPGELSPGRRPPAAAGPPS